MLPGKPDLVLKKYNAIIFINGCFWHMHDCHLFHWPKSNAEFWKTKISQNQKNDTANYEKLFAAGWRIAVIWECSLKGKGKLNFNDIIDRTCDWLNGKEIKLEIAGST